MRKRWFLVGILFLLLSWLLVGCGVAQEQYDIVVADLGKAQQDLQTTRTELESVRSELGTTKSELESVRSELGTTESELESIKTELTASQSKVSELTSSLGKSEADLETKQAELDGAKKELNEIKKVYPARYFSSKKELQDWLYENDVSGRPVSTIAEPLYEKALDMQEDALKDGYIISAFIDYYEEEGIFIIVLEAVADGNVYIWNPETDDLINFSEATGLLKVRQ